MNDTLEAPAITIHAAVLHQPKDEWCVWTKHGRRPRYFHQTRELAVAEAERLAIQHPGWKFIVMHMTDKVSAGQ